MSDVVCLCSNAVVLDVLWGRFHVMYLFCCWFATLQWEWPTKMPKAFCLSFFPCHAGNDRWSKKDKNDWYLCRKLIALNITNDSHKPFLANADLVQWKTIRHDVIVGVVQGLLSPWGLPVLFNAPTNYPVRMLNLMCCWCCCYCCWLIRCELSGKYWYGLGFHPGMCCAIHTHDPRVLVTSSIWRAH